MQYQDRTSGPPRPVDGPECTHPENCCKGPGVCTHDCPPRLVDGPGCTPTPFVPGVLAAFREVTEQTASTGHGPEDYDQEDQGEWELPSEEELGRRIGLWP